MDGRALAMVAKSGHGSAMRFEHGRCVALVIDPASGTLRCGIYAMRPDACRWLKQGSLQCREHVRDKGAAALVMLRRSATTP